MKKEIRPAKKIQNFRKRPVKVGKKHSISVLKTKRMLAKVPISTHYTIKNKILKKYGIKSFQAVFDYIIIGGVLYFNRGIMDIVNENIEVYRERNVKSKLARMGKCEAPEFPKYKHVNFFMYEKDAKGLADFAIEKNCAKQWLVEILFGALADENPVVIDFIKRGQGLNVRSRKKQVARIVEDEWIKILPERESLQILMQLTENFDKKSFNSNIQGEIDKLIEERDERMDLDLEEDRIFAEKMKTMRKMREKQVDELSEPRDEKKA